jgi:hypothetical protein
MITKSQAINGIITKTGSENPSAINDKKIKPPKKAPHIRKLKIILIIK